VTYLSKDGEEGDPGSLSVTVVFSATDANELRIDYSATTDKDTVVRACPVSPSFAPSGLGNAAYL
jgi:aldose 1-epimerase